MGEAFISKSIFPQVIESLFIDQHIIFTLQDGSTVEKKGKYSIDFASLKGLVIEEGIVIKVEDADGNVLWDMSDVPDTPTPDVPEVNETIILQVSKITSNTYKTSDKTSYTSEQFILLDIYPKTNGTVTITYDGITKTITDTSGADSPASQQVFFGTFNGVSDGSTSSSGTLTIEGDYRAFGISKFNTAKSSTGYCTCITAVDNLGIATEIPQYAFYTCTSLTGITIPDTVTTIGANAFYLNNGYTRTVTMQSTTPPTLGADNVFDTVGTNNIVVPAGCGDTYKAATNWSEYANYITEAAA